MLIPKNIQWLKTKEGGQEWLDTIPDLLQACLERWDMTLDGPPMTGGNVSFIQPVLRDGESYILKIQWPHPECEHEAAALEAWRGIGAVKLIEHDPVTHALLIERCKPGHYLAHGKCDTIAVFVGMLPRLWVTTRYPFNSLEDEATRWLKELREARKDHHHDYELDLIDQAIELGEALPSTQGENVLLHQDLHGYNVLSSRREPWLVIDPKPLVGEREFSLAPVIRSFEYGHSVEDVKMRLDMLSQTLHLDRERVRRWTILQTMAWSFDSSYKAQHHETVSWLLQMT